MKVKLKLLNDLAVVPSYSRPGDAGMDIVATSVKEYDSYIEYGTGISLSIPEGFVGLIYPRSSLSNYDLILSNHVGVIDSNYTGEIRFRFKRAFPLNRAADQSGVHSKIYHPGDRVGQLIIVPIPKVEFTLVEELGESVRGAAGFGSSDTLAKPEVSPFLSGLPEGAVLLSSQNIKDIDSGLEAAKAGKFSDIAFEPEVKKKGKKNEEK